MKFPRNSRQLRNQFDVAPFAAVFLLLVILLMLGTLLPTPGLPLQLPVLADSSKDLRFGILPDLRFKPWRSALPVFRRRVCALNFHRRRI